MKTDVFVVGGGPAGLSSAIELSKLGLKVILCEKKSFPIDKPCGEGIMPKGIAHLKRLEVFSLLNADAMHPFFGVCLINQKGVKAFGDFKNNFGVGIRRVSLSNALLERAQQFSTLTILAKNRILSLKKEAGLMKITTEQGIFFSPIVIGADGLRSKIRKMIRLEKNSRSIKRYGMRAHFKIPPFLNYVEVFFNDQIEAYVTPTGPDLTNVAFLFSKKIEQEVFLNNPFENFLKKFPELSERFSHASLISKPLAIGPFEQNCISPIADGVALLGDASGYFDAITGEGVSLAMSQAQVLSEVIFTALNKNPKELITKEQLKPYEKAHRALMQTYYQNAKLVYGLANRPFLMEKTVDLLSKNEAILSFILTKMHIKN